MSSRRKPLPPEPGDDLERSLWDPRHEPQDPLVGWLQQRLSSHSTPHVVAARRPWRWIAAGLAAAALFAALWLCWPDAGHTEAGPSPIADSPADDARRAPANATGETQPSPGEPAGR